MNRVGRLAGGFSERPLPDVCIQADTSKTGGAGESAVVDFEVFRAELQAALARADRTKGGQPPYDAVLMFKVLVVQMLYALSDDATEYQLKDRLLFMRFCGLALHDPVPDAKTIWLFREQLTRAGVIGRLFAQFDAILRERGYLAMGASLRDITRTSFVG